MLFFKLKYKSTKIKTHLINTTVKLRKNFAHKTLYDCQNLLGTFSYVVPFPKKNFSKAEEKSLPAFEASGVSLASFSSSAKIVKGFLQELKFSNGLRQQVLKRLHIGENTELGCFSTMMENTNSVQVKRPDWSISTPSNAFLTSASVPGCPMNLINNSYVSDGRTYNLDYKYQL